MGQRGIVNKYISKLEIVYKEHNILQRAQELATKILQTIDNNNPNCFLCKFDKLDRDSIEYMHAVEKNLDAHLQMEYTNGPLG